MKDLWNVNLSTSKVAQPTGWQFVYDIIASLRITRTRREHGERCRRMTTIWVERGEKCMQSSLELEVLVLLFLNIFSLNARHTKQLKNSKQRDILREDERVQSIKNKLQSFPSLASTHTQLSWLCCWLCDSTRVAYGCCRCVDSFELLSNGRRWNANTRRKSPSVNCERGLRLRDCRFFSLHRFISNKTERWWHRVKIHSLLHDSQHGELAITAELGLWNEIAS